MNSAICKASREMIAERMIKVINKAMEMEIDLGRPLDSNLEQRGNNNKAKIKEKDKSINKSFIQYIPVMTRQIEMRTEASRKE